MSDQFHSLAAALEQASDLLLACGNLATAPRLVELAGRVRSGEDQAIVSSISEATGGAGSLNDQSLYPASAADAQLRKIIEKIEKLARSIARERGIALVR